MSKASPAILMYQKFGEGESEQLRCAIAAACRDYRRRTGRSKEQVQAILGLSVTGYWNIENGKHLPQAPTLLQLACLSFEVHDVVIRFLADNRVGEKFSKTASTVPGTDCV